MKTRYALLLIALLPLAACKNDTPAPVGEADIAAAATPVAKQASAEDPTVKVKGDAEAKAAAESAAKAPPPVAGTDYAVIADSHLTRPTVALRWPKSSVTCARSAPAWNRLFAR
jgi:hypothetical protein